MPGGPSEVKPFLLWRINSALVSSTRKPRTTGLGQWSERTTREIPRNAHALDPPAVATAPPGRFANKKPRLQGKPPGFEQLGRQPLDFASPPSASRSLALGSRANPSK